MTEEKINLRAVLEDGLTIELCRSMSVTFASGQLKACWAAKIYRKRTTRSGRPGKPEYIIGLAGKESDGPADILKMLAIALEQGDVPISTKKAGLGDRV